MKKVCYRVFNFFSLLLFSSFFIFPLCPQHSDNKLVEKILNFDCDIVVHKDGSIIVEEYIEILALGETFKHGLRREIPTYYKDEYGAWYGIDLEIRSIHSNAPGKKYHIKEGWDSLGIYIGEEKKLLPPGTYYYLIKYKVHRGVAFLEQYDELYWNVTGNYWDLPIEHASCRVQLPKNIFAQDIQMTGYAGVTGSRKKNYEIVQTKLNNAVGFVTKTVLQPGEGFTIVVTWPKVFVAAPSLFITVSYFIRDNFFYIWLLITIIMSLCYIVIYLMRRSKPGPIVLESEPPLDMAPSEIEFILKKGKPGFFPKGFAADMVQMATQGYFDITQKDKSFRRKEYTLKKKASLAEQLMKEPTELQKILLNKFIEQDELPLTKKNRNLFEVLNKIRTDIITDKYYGRLLYIEYKYLWFWLISTSAFFIFTSLFPRSMLFDKPYWIMFIVCNVINVLFTFGLMRFYTKEGQILRNQIDGFKEYLKTLKKVGDTQEVEKTPALYEQFLPYAMVFGIEAAWAQLFAATFLKMQEQGNGYIPYWYYGSRPFTFNATRFSTNLSRSFGKTLNNISGAGGLGGSGGGRGGGGGGGW